MKDECHEGMAPVFQGQATQEDLLLGVSSAECASLPVGNLLEEASASEKGEAKVFVTYTMAGATIQKECSFVQGRPVSYYLRKAHLIGMRKSRSTYIRGKEVSFRHIPSARDTIYLVAPSRVRFYLERNR